MSERDPSINIGGNVSGQVVLGNEAVQIQQTTPATGRPQQMTVLFWAANPTDTSQLRLGEEVRTIDERLVASGQGDQFDLRQQWAVRYTDLSDGLLRHDPHVLHFSGHGSPSGTIMLEDTDGTAREISVDALADLAGLAGDRLRCVILNACYSERQARAIATHVDCVVGTSTAIGDAAAISFAAGFYRALGYGRSVQNAFDLGRNEIELAGLGEEATPRLIMKDGVDAAAVHLGQQPT